VDQCQQFNNKITAFVKMDKSLIYNNKSGFVKLSNGRADGLNSIDLVRRSVNGCQPTRTIVQGSVKSLVLCPICSTHIIFTEDKDVNAYLGNSLDSNMMSGHTVPKLLLNSDNGTHVICETCNNDESEVICIECNQKLCFDCTKVHLRSTATRKHHVTGIPGINGIDSPSSVRKSLTTLKLNGNDERYDSLHFNGLSASLPNSVDNSLGRQDKRLSQVRHSDIYQRGNSPRPTEKRKRFEYKEMEPKSWETDFSLVTTFDVGSYVLSMCAASRDQCWVAEAMSTAIHLYNMEGQRLKTVDAQNEVRDMAVNKATDDIYVTCFANKSVKVIDRNKEVSNFLFLPLHPAGITINTYGDIVVCCVEDFRRRYRPEHRNRLMIYSREGKLKREIEKDHNGKILHYPEYIDININGDMCVSDIESESLVILREDGRLKSIYKGPTKGTLDNSFDPRDVKCDKDGNIIVCDINNNALHLLDINGDFTRILLCEQDGIYWPDILSIDHRDHIWVRELWQQSIKVYQSLGSR